MEGSRLFPVILFFFAIFGMGRLRYSDGKSIAGPTAKPTRKRMNSNSETESSSPHPELEFPPAKRSCAVRKEVEAIHDDSKAGVDGRPGESPLNGESSESEVEVEVKVEVEDGTDAESEDTSDDDYEDDSKAGVDGRPVDSSLNGESSESEVEMEAESEDTSDDDYEEKKEEEEEEQEKEEDDTWDWDCDEEEEEEQEKEEDDTWDWDEYGFSDKDCDETDNNLEDANDKAMFDVFNKHLIRYQKSTMDLNSQERDGNCKSPFDGEHDEVNKKFDGLWEDAYGSGFDMGSLVLRNDPGEARIALSKEELGDLKTESEPFLASAEHMDTYLHYRLNEFPDSILQRVHACSAYNLSIHLLSGKACKGAGLGLFEEALYSELKPVDYNLIPLLGG